MDKKYSGFGQIPPELQKKLGIADGNGIIDTHKLQKRARRELFIGFFPFVVIAAVLISVFFFPYYFAGFFEIFDRGPIKGRMLDLAYVPYETGNGKVWIVTDPSFSFIQKVETPGSYSVSTECVGCKIRVYIFDQESYSVVNQWDIPLKNHIIDADLHYGSGAVWLTSGHYRNNEPLIFKYDATTGRELYNNESFVSAKKEFTASLIELVRFENPYRLNIKLADGKSYIYLVDEDKFFTDASEFNKYYKTEKTITVFGLSKESSNERTNLYKITGSANEVMDGRCDSWASDSDSIRFFCKASSEKIGDEIFIEALIVYQDEEMAVLFHQDALGKGAKRQLSAYSVEGKKLWVVPQEELFQEIGYDPGKPFSQLFFIQSRLSAQREGDVFVFTVDQVGAVGLNAKTGSQLWKIIP